MKLSKELTRKVLQSQTAELPLWVSLPLPPTTNNLFINAGKKRIISPAYRAWKPLAAIALRNTSSVQVKPVAITCVVRAGKGWRIDSDVANREKAAVDALVEAGVLFDDSCVYVQSVTSVLVWGDKTEPTGFFVHIDRYVESSIVEQSASLTPFAV